MFILSDPYDLDPCFTVDSTKEGILEDFLKKDGRTNTSAVVQKGTSGRKWLLQTNREPRELVFFSGSFYLPSF